MVQNTGRAKRTCIEYSLSVIMNYLVIKGVENDTTGKRFEPGETVTNKDFPEDVIDGWLQKGVLKKQVVKRGNRENQSSTF